MDQKLVAFNFGVGYDLENEMENISKDLVGYKNPPTRSQFQKGRSGNPKGRPKKREKSLREIINAELAEKIYVTINGQSKYLSRKHCLAKKFIDLALKDKAYMRLLLDYIDEDTLPDEQPPLTEPIVYATEEEAFNDFVQTIKRTQLNFHK